MNKNLIIVLGGGFVIALLVALIVQAGLSGGKGEKGSEILVAARALPVGQELTSSDVRWKSWPKDSVLETMIVRKDSKQAVGDVAKGRLRRAVESGEPVFQTNLVSADSKGNILSAALDPGMRALAIKVKAESMVGGFISPGDRVDVIMTYEVKISDRNNPEVAQKVQKYATETVLENVRVLAIDQQARKEDDKAKVGRTVTLEVDAKGAEKLSLAGVMGDLSLSLRPVGDESVSSGVNRSLTTDAQISEVLREVNALKSGGNAAPANVVRVYNGENVQNIVVRKSSGPQPSQD